jgi:hypothetical protein
MNHEENRNAEVNETEVQTQKRMRLKSTSPAQVNDVEDPRCYNALMERLLTELKPQNVLQEGDLVSLAQLRWSSERLNSLVESDLNFHVRLPQLQNFGDTSARLLTAYKLCLGEKTFVLMHKQHLDTIKTMNTLSARIEKWATPKTPRSTRSKEV